MLYLNTAERIGAQRPTGAASPQQYTATGVLGSMYRNVSQLGTCRYELVKVWTVSRPCLVSGNIRRSLGMVLVTVKICCAWYEEGFVTV